MDRSLLPEDAPIYVPNGWEPVDAVLAWAAFGSALRRWDWDRYLYLGSQELWPRFEVLRTLMELMHGFGRPKGRPGGDPPAAGVDAVTFEPAPLPSGVRGALDNIEMRFELRHKLRAATRPPDRSQSDAYERRAARILYRQLRREFRADKRWGNDDTDADLSALRAADRAFCRAVAEGRLPAFGWPGARPGGRRDITSPRSRIPPALCEAPVSFDAAGCLVPCLPDDAGLALSIEPLFHDVLVPADAVLSIWPAQGGGEADAGRELTIPAAERRTRRREGERGPGGRPPRHDWAPFTREVVRILALDAGSLPRGELKNRMKDWAVENMPTDPDLRTVEKMVDSLVAPGVIPD